MGLNNFIFGSDGSCVPNPRFARKAEKKVAECNRRLARCELPLPEGRGFWLRWRLPCARISPRAWSSIASTSSSGHSTRQYPQPFVADVDSRVVVSVVVRTAVGTRPRTDIERHLVANRTTCGARFGTRIPAVAPDERLASAGRLVFEEAREHAPSRVSRSFREAVVRHDPFHMQVFDGDDLVLINDPP